MQSTDHDLRRLASGLTGQAFTRDDPGFADAALAHNRSVVHVPDVVVSAAVDGDVAAAVRFAASRGLDLWPQATGHGAREPITSGILIVTTALDRVAIDPSARTATFGAGAKWSAVIAAAAEHGLSPVVGSSAGVGAVGYLVGGGIGPLNRSHGVSSDYVRSFTAVTGAGEDLTASITDNPDLFWALRGSKAGIGLVTAATVDLVELPDLYAGALFFAESDIETALRGWADWLGTSPSDVTTSAAIIRFPPFPAVPEPLRGKTMLSVRFAFPGPSETGADLAAPLRALAPVALDALGRLPATEIARIHNDPTDPAPSRVSAVPLARLDQGAVDVVLAHAGRGVDTPFVSVEIRQLGEASTRDVTEGSAVGGRSVQFLVGYVVADPNSFERAAGAADRLVDALEPWLADQSVPNFVGPIGAARLPSPWTPDAARRIRQIKDQYDPAGLIKSFGPFSG